MPGSGVPPTIWAVASVVMADAPNSDFPPQALPGVPTAAEALAGLEMPLLEAMMTQRAVRRLLPDPVDGAVVLKCIELALGAPTGSNGQNWEFVVVVSSVGRPLSLGIDNARVYGRPICSGMPSRRVSFSERLVFLFSLEKKHSDHSGC